MVHWLAYSVRGLALVPKLIASSKSWMVPSGQILAATDSAAVIVIIVIVIVIVILIVISPKIFLI